MSPNYWGMQGSSRLSAVRGKDCPCVSPRSRRCLWAPLKLWCSEMPAKTGEGSGSGCQVADRMDKGVSPPPPPQPLVPKPLSLPLPSAGDVGAENG